eukprot:TRINITY_DN9522_c0_g1_i1.p1 TRINITY_DN9522_c0_g1~~TRINITY_DN9522_c0_g1_i1.p1  ORF type:complete len:615 (-),score=67.01 TRINITY_DN9522_c0_g1_i1:97-1908(-)
MPRYLELLEQLRSECERLASESAHAETTTNGDGNDDGELHAPWRNFGQRSRWRSPWSADVGRSQTQLSLDAVPHVDAQVCEVAQEATHACEVAPEVEAQACDVAPNSEMDASAYESSSLFSEACEAASESEGAAAPTRMSRLIKDMSKSERSVNFFGHNGETDVGTQYNAMIHRYDSKKSNFDSCCGWVSAEDTLAWINQRRLPFRDGILGRAVGSKFFHFIVSTLIVANVIFIIIESDAVLRLSFSLTRSEGVVVLPSVGTAYKHIDLFFTLAFAFELCLRMLVEELAFLFGRNWKWNVFDSCLVTTSVMESFLDGAGIDATFARVLRVLRMSRALRIIRMFRAFRELRMLLDSIFHILFPLAWSVLLLSIVNVMFGLIFTNAVNAYLISDECDDSVKEQLAKYFSSAPTTFVSLFKTLTNGESWGYIMEPLQSLSEVYVVIFVMFVLFMQLGVLNIITSVFVGNATLLAQMDMDMIQLMEAEQHAYTMRKLDEVFSILDKDDIGSITLNEFEDWTRIEKVKAFFERVLRLEAWKVGRFFRMLDINGDDRIDKQEFVVGCMRLKGDAKNMDQEVLTHLAKLIKQDVKWVKHSVDEIKTNMHR